VRALLFKVEHRRQQLIRRNRSAATEVGYLVVLAEPAAEVAVAEEDRSGAARAGDGWFFPVVELGEGDDELLRRATDAARDGAVDAALERTGLTLHYLIIRGAVGFDRPARVTLV
jgi:hypothetical protein